MAQETLGYTAISATMPIGIAIRAWSGSRGRR